MMAFAIALLMIAALMVVSAIVGGNTEYRGLKIPKVGVFSRAGLFVTGGAAFVMAMGVAAVAEYDDSGSSTDVPDDVAPVDDGTTDAAVVGGPGADPVDEPPTDSPDDPPTEAGGGTGSTALDGLYDACASEDYVACDELYWTSPAGSDYESFGATCGGLVDPVDGDCEELHHLLGLYESCEGGDYEACADLYWGAAAGSEFEWFGATCGGREVEGTCA